MLKLAFGLTPKDNTIRAWGARAILDLRDYSKPFIDLLHDRQDYQSKKDEKTDKKEKTKFVNWINKKGLPFLRKNAWQFDPSEAEQIELTQGNYYILANTNASYGYLYIVAGELS